MAKRRRTSTLHLLRALWRYRGAIAHQGDRFQGELATAVRTALAAQVGGRVALAGYRASMRVMSFAAIALVVVAVVLDLILISTVSVWWALLGLPLLALAAWIWFLRTKWGLPLDWLQEHAVEGETISLSELPERLRAAANDLRALSNVPANISRELDELAANVEREQAPHEL